MAKVSCFAFAILVVFLTSLAAAAVSLPVDHSSLKKLDKRQLIRASSLSTELSAAGVKFTQADALDYVSSGSIPLIVRYRNAPVGSVEGKLSAANAALVGAYYSGGRFKAAFSKVPAIAVEVPRGSLKQFTSIARTSPAIEEISVDTRVHVLLDKSVPLIFPPAEKSALEARFGKIDGSGVRIAILDTGINKNHPDLASLSGNPANNDPKVVEEISFVGGSPADANGHGTQVAGIAAGTGFASNGKYAGVAPQAMLLNAKVIDDSGNGLESGIVQGIEWAVEHGANVISMSLGCSAPCRAPELEAAVRNAVKNNVTVVIAAGNDGPGFFTIASPAVEENAISVGSSNHEGTQPSFFSSEGPTDDLLFKPELLAPGEEIVAPSVHGGYNNEAPAPGSPLETGVAVLSTQPYDFLDNSIKTGDASRRDDAANGLVGDGISTGGFFLSHANYPDIAFSGPVNNLGTYNVIQQDGYYASGVSYYDTTKNSYVADRLRIAYAVNFTDAIPYHVDIVNGDTAGRDPNDGMITENRNIVVRFLGRDFTITNFKNGTPTTNPSISLGQSAIFMQMHEGDSVRIDDKTLELVSISPRAQSSGTFPEAAFKLFDADGAVIDFFTMTQGSADYNKNGIILHVREVFLGSGGTSFADISIFSRVITLTDGQKIIFEGDDATTQLNNEAGFTASLTFGNRVVAGQDQKTLRQIRIDGPTSGKVLPGQLLNLIAKPVSKALAFLGLEPVPRDSLSITAKGRQTLQNVTNSSGDPAPTGFNIDVNVTQLKSGFQGAFSLGGKNYDTLFIDKYDGRFLAFDASTGNYSSAGVQGNSIGYFYPGTAAMDAVQLFTNFSRPGPLGLNAVPTGGSSFNITNPDGSPATILVAYNDSTGSLSLPSQATAAITGEPSSTGALVSWVPVPGASAYFVYKQNATGTDLIGVTQGAFFNTSASGRVVVASVASPAIGRRAAKLRIRDRGVNASNALNGFFEIDLFPQDANTLFDASLPSPGLTVNYAFTGTPPASSIANFPSASGMAVQQGYTTPGGSVLSAVALSQIAIDYPKRMPLAAFKFYSPQQTVPATPPSGTSFAAPHVAGAAALLKQVRPSYSPAQVKSALVQNALDLGANPFAQGAGLVQAGRAINASVLASPPVVNLGALPFNSTAMFNITFANTSAGEFGVALSFSNATDLHDDKFTAPASLSLSSFCLNATQQSRNESIFLNASNLSFGSYAFFVAAKVFDNCAFTGGAKNLSVPVAFSKVREINLTLSSPAFFPGENELKIAVVYVLENATPTQLFLVLPTAGKSQSLKIRPASAKPDLLVNFITATVDPDFNLVKWRDDYSLRGIDFSQNNFASVSVDDGAIPVVKNNAAQLLSASGLEEYLVSNQFIAGTTPLIPISISDEGRNVKNSRNWTVALEAVNANNASYSFFLVAAGKPKGVRFFDSTSFMVLPFKDAYPFSSLGATLSPSDIGSGQVDIRDAMPAGLSQSFSAQLQPFIPEANGFLGAPTGVPFEQRLPPKAINFSYRKCSACAYNLTLAWNRFDLQTGEFQSFSVDKFYPSSSPLAATVPLLAKPFAQAFTLSSSDNFVGNNLVNAFVFDAFARGGTQVITRVAATGSVASIRDPNGLTVFDSRNPGFSAPAKDPDAFFAFACSRFSCIDGNYTLSWNMTNVFKGQNLSLRVVLEWSSLNQEFTVRSIRRDSQPAVGAPAAGNIAVSPPVQQAGSNVTATIFNLTDAFGLAVPDGTQVNFSIFPVAACFPGPIGSACPAVTGAKAVAAFAANGIASAQLSSSVPGVFTIAAVFNGNALNSTNVTFVSGNAGNALISATPSSAIAGTAVIISVTNVTDAKGNAVADGTVIGFSASRGSIAASNTTLNASTTATLSFNGTGEVIVTALSGPTPLNSTKVVFFPGPPATLSLSASPSRPAFHSNATVNAFVADAFGNGVANGAVVLFNTSLGAITPSSATVNGVASAQLRSETAGRALVRAALASNDSIAATLEVLFTSNCSITASPSVSQGPFASIVFVNFTDSPTDASRARISCGAGLKTRNAPVVGNYAIAICRYPQVQSEAQFDLVVQAGDSSCTKRIRDLP